MLTTLAFAGLAVVLLTAPNYGSANQDALQADIYLVDDNGSNTQTVPPPDHGGTTAPAEPRNSGDNNSDPPLHFRTAPTPPTPPNAEGNAPALDPDAQRE